MEQPQSSGKQIITMKWIPQNMLEFKPDAPNETYATLKKQMTFTLSCTRHLDAHRMKLEGTHAWERARKSQNA